MVNRADKINALLLRRKLIASALYHQDDWEQHRQRNAIELQSHGLPSPDGDCTDYLEVWERAGANIRRKDPGRILGLIVLRQMDYQKGTDEYTALGNLFDEYQKIPDDQRTDVELNQRFRSRLDGIVGVRRQSHKV